MFIKGSNGLLTSETGERLKPYDKEWHLNLGLLSPAYKRTADPELKERIGFLALQYLARASHINLSDLAVSYSVPMQLQRLYQLGLFQESTTYHRSSSIFERFLIKSMEQLFVPSSKNLFLLTDTADFAHLLSLYFTVVDLNQTQSLPIEKPLLLDLTSHFEGCIQTDDGEFILKMAQIKEIIERAKLPSPPIPICRCTVKGIGVIKILPLFFDLPPHQVIDRSHHYLSDFLNLTGIRLGGVRARESVFHFLDFPTFLKLNESIFASHHHMTSYFPQGKNVRYFSGKCDLIESRVFHNFEKVKGVLIGATADLLKGLFSEISEERWEALNGNPDSREILQAILMRLINHLAKAPYQVDNFAHLTTTLELIHSEIASLLILTSPFEKSDFDPIYKKHLSHIPDHLRPFVKTGVARSAMYLFAEILSHSRQPAMLPGVYHEQQPLIGKENTLDKVLQNPSIERVDLFVSEFNPNINKELSHSHYQARHPIEDIINLLKTKPKTERLTVLMDSTIDYVGSTKAGKLLRHFSKEIEEGRLNFVFMRSGQKFDMLGMDNYYGSPFYSVNNGADHWPVLKACQTDLLSMQWFSLANKYAFERMEEHRGFIFSNTRTILRNIPEIFKEGPIRISTFERGINPCFIDIKILSKPSLSSLVRKTFLNTFQKAGRKVYSKPGFGFLSPNFLSLLTEEGTPRIIRINPGIDPLDAKILILFLNNLSKLVTKML